MWEKYSLILVDLNQVTFSTIAAITDRVTVDENLVRHVVLNCIRSYRSKFAAKYGELVLCSDNRNYWRRNIFPYYKANRKKDRDASGLNWPAIFAAMDKIRSELTETFPYKVLDVDGAEADDIIGTLVNHLPYQEETIRGSNLDAFFGDGQNTFLIVSADKDFIQLHRKGVEQYNPIMKMWVKHPDPKVKLFEHIIKGDKGDGVPNIRSSDDSLVKNERAKPITKNLIDELRAGLNTTHPLYRNFVRNRQLIDLTYIPESIQQKILNEFSSQQTKGRDKLFNYFMTHSLKHLIESIGDF